MKSTREVATEIVSELRGNFVEHGCISFYHFEDCIAHRERIAAILDDFLAEGGGICS